jgi:adenylosuccinate synthase
VLVDPDVTLDEVARLGIADRLGIDPQCTVIDPADRETDRERAHLRDVVGTTGTGTGPANEARTARRARIARDEPRLAGFLADVAAELNNAVRSGRDVIVEGTQGLRLSLYHGDYPYVTSKDTSASAMCADVGLGPTLVDEVLVVFKAFASRVGNGPMPTEISQELAAERGWLEFGSVTGRPRRIGEFDYEQSARAVMVNGATEIAITNLDRRFPGSAGVRDWTALPSDARAFVEEVESALDVPASVLSTGPDVWDTIDRR